MPLRLVIAVLFTASCAVAHVQQRDILHITPPDGFTTPASGVFMTVCADSPAGVASVCVNSVPLAFISNTLWRTHLALVHGPNSFMVSVTASNGASTTAPVVYFRGSNTFDNTPSATFVFSPPDGAVLFAPEIEMGIAIWDKRSVATLAVNGLAAVSAGNNLWRCPLTLSPGTNRFCVVAQFTDQSCATSQVAYMHHTSQMSGDTIPPAILSVWPPDGTLTTNLALAVRLCVMDNHAVASVSVNQQLATALPSNVWLATLPLVPGLNPALVVAEDLAGNALTQLLSYVRVVPPHIVSTAAPPAVLDAPYALHLLALGGTPPLHWALSALPPGLLLSNDWIVGVPATTGCFIVAAAVYDSLGYADRSMLRILVHSPLHILTSQLPDAYLAQPYAFRLVADGGDDPVSWTAATVPDGLSVLDNGQIIGTPSSTGKFELIITVTDSRGRSLTQPLPIIIKEISDYLLLAMPGGALPEVPAGETCTLALPVDAAASALGSPCPVPGVSLSPAGLLHGTPAPGFYVVSSGAAGSWVWSTPPRDKDSLGAFVVKRIQLSSRGTSGSLRLTASSPLPPGLRLHASLPVVLSLGGFTVASPSACICSPQRYRAVFPLEGGAAALSISLAPGQQLAWSLALRRVPHLAERVTRFAPADGSTRTLYATVLLGPHSAHAAVVLSEQTSQIRRLAERGDGCAVACPPRLCRGYGTRTPFAGRSGD